MDQAADMAAGREDVAVEARSDTGASSGGGRAKRKSAAPKPKGRKRLRLILLVVGPLLVALVAGYFWLTSGRYVSTDNAYVKADKVAITAEVTGSIANVAVKENEHVEKGSLLFEVDPRTYQIALDRAEAQLAETHAVLEALKASYRQAQEQLKLARTDVEFAQREFDRRSELAGNKVVSQQALDTTRHALDSARQQLAIKQQALAELRAQLGGDPDRSITEHPRYLAAKAARDQAALDLKRTTVEAPFAGVAGNVPKVGQHVESGTAVMSIVADDRQWINANFKETDLTRVRPGQPVSITVDTYPDRHFEGVVDSISQATGAEFSVLPPQNATGNWVKVVQRIPVRIDVRQEAGAPPLRAGMSAEVEIDTGAGGQPLSAHAAEKPTASIKP